MRETHKDVVLGGKTYRVSKMTARVGSYVAWLVATHALPSTVESGFASGGAALPSGRTSISEKDFHDLQEACLAVCSVPEVVGGVEVNRPLVHTSGRFNNPDLETDLVTVLALTAHALIFNILPFFEVETMKQTMESFRTAYPALNQLIVKASTPTSSVQ